MREIFAILVGWLSLQCLAGEKDVGGKVSDIRKGLTVEEKIDLLCADAPAVDRLGIIRYDWWSECLNGVARAGKATAFPKPIGLGATWDVELVKRISTAISDEARAKHRKVMEEKGYSPRQFGLTFFSPTLNIARDPRWGRTSECFSEDPLLTGEMGVAYVQGLQGDDARWLKAVATIKHFVANNEENRRAGGSADVDELSLRQFYLPAFREAVVRGGAASVMGAYNALNGVPCCANAYLLNDVLRKEWGFRGVVISDGSAVEKIYTHHKYASTPAEAAAMALKSGCDMSLRDEYRDGLRKAYTEKLIDDEDLDRAVDRVLELRVRLGLDGDTGGNPYADIPYSVVECPAHRELALEAAEKSMVLLKNDGLLPLELGSGDVRKIALIGDAFNTVYYGDYSASPEINEVLWDCLRDAVGSRAELSWVGERTKEETVPSRYLSRRVGEAHDGILGFTGEYYADKEAVGTPLLVRQDLVLDFVPAMDDKLKSAKDLSARWTSVLQAPLTGRYSFMFEGSGRVSIRIDGKVVFRKGSNQKVRGSFELPLVKGQEYQVEVEACGMKAQQAVRLSWRLPFDDKGVTPEKLAKESDVAILFLRDDNSSEGRDRKDLHWGEAQIELIRKVTEANPNTILILGSGSPLMLAPFVRLPKAILNVWMGGQGEARAITHILLGKVNPSGKTPVTFFADERQLPPMDSYDVTKGRSYQYFKGDVMFPFGYGLSYTRFEYSRPVVDKSRMSGSDTLSVEVTVSNKGGYDGEEIVQCYLSAPQWAVGGLKQKLIGHKRVFMAKGESRKVSFTVCREDLLRWNVNVKEWTALAGKYEVSVVPHSGEKNAVSFVYEGK